MALTWATAVDKHGIAHEDAVHAMLNALYVETDFDEPRPPADIRPTHYIGPQRDRTPPLLEVMVEPRPPRDLHVFHVMPARRKHLSRMQ